MLLPALQNAVVVEPAKKETIEVEAGKMHEWKKVTRGNRYSTFKGKYFKSVSTERFKKRKGARPSMGHSHTSIR